MEEGAKDGQGVEAKDALDILVPGDGGQALSHRVERGLEETQLIRVPGEDPEARIREARGLETERETHGSGQGRSGLCISIHVDPL